MILLSGILLILSFPSSQASAPKYRTIEISKTQAATVLTAPGIATIIETVDTPTSVVLGNKRLFKIEFLERAITVRPMRPGASTNLYLFTGNDRFIIDLRSGSRDLSDYSVKLRRLSNAQPDISDKKWTPIGRTIKNGELSYKLERARRGGLNVFYIEFEITALTKCAVSPQSIWVTQEGKTRAINALFISHLSLDSRVKAKGVIE
ncbi:MAG: hypothetical protein EOP06_24015, partial [Proteobacteria bacterium]